MSSEIIGDIHVAAKTLTKPARGRAAFALHSPICSQIQGIEWPAVAHGAACSVRRI
jgi:hypothetical protein